MSHAQGVSLKISLGRFEVLEMQRVRAAWEETFIELVATHVLGFFDVSL